MFTADKTSQAECERLQAEQQTLEHMKLEVFQIVKKLRAHLQKRVKFASKL
jgi:hypothetical protein